MTHKYLLFGGISLTSCAIVQTLSFLAVAYPQTTQGATFILLLALFSVVVTGVINWIKVDTHYHGRHPITRGYIPTLLMLPLFFLFLIGGLQLAQYVK